MKSAIVLTEFWRAREHNHPKYGVTQFPARESKVGLLVADIAYFSDISAEGRENKTLIRFKDVERQQVHVMESVAEIAAQINDE